MARPHEDEAEEGQRSPSLINSTGNVKAGSHSLELKIRRSLEAARAVARKFRMEEFDFHSEIAARALKKRMNDKGVRPPRTSQQPTKETT